MRARLQAPVSYTAADDWNTVSRENRRQRIRLNTTTATVLRNGLQNSEGFFVKRTTELCPLAPQRVLEVWFF